MSLESTATEVPGPGRSFEIAAIASTESFHNCYESYEFIQFQYTVDDLLLAASTAATIFNFLVVFCAFKLFKRSGDTMHLFIINMTLGDLVLTVFSLPNEFLMRKHTFLRHIHLCALIHFCNWLGLAVSGLSLTLLNVDKLIYFRWPLKYDQTMSKRRAAVLCIFIWGVSFGFVSYVWIFNIVYATPDCMLQMTDVKKYYYEIFMIMFCVLPVTSSLFLSTYLFRLTRQKRHAPARSDGHVDIRTFKNKVRSLVFIFATTAWTSFSLLPYRIFNICRIHLFDWNAIECEQRVVMNWLAWLLIYLLTLNPIVNPVITSIIYAPYRMTLKKLLINIPIVRRTRGRGADGQSLAMTRLTALAAHQNGCSPAYGPPLSPTCPETKPAPTAGRGGSEVMAAPPSARPAGDATDASSVRVDAFASDPSRRRQRRNAVVTVPSQGRLDDVVSFIDDSASDTTSPAATSPESHARRAIGRAGVRERVSPLPDAAPPPATGQWRDDTDAKRLPPPSAVTTVGQRLNKICFQNCEK